MSGKIALYSEYDYFEVWLDYLESIDHSEITHVIKTYPNKIIFVSRRLALEPIKRDFNNRMSLLESLALEPCIFDFDIKIQQDELEYTALQGLPIKKLISYHNYQRTPDTVDLEKILLEMDTFDPTISKLACFCETALDALRLLELTYKESQRKPVIILGMGQHGLPTRIFGSYKDVPAVNQSSKVLSKTLIISAELLSVLILYVGASSPSEKLFSEIVMFSFAVVVIET